MNLSRRSLLRSAALSAALTTMPAGVKMAWGAPGSDDVLIVIAMRGGWDGLHLIAPVNDADYVAARGEALRVTANGDQRGIAVTSGPLTQNHEWRFHGRAPNMARLYHEGQLAVVHAAGLTADTRSHFQAIDLMETGSLDEGQLAAATGWTARHLNLRGGTAAFTGLSTGPLMPISWRGFPGAIAIGDTGDLSLANPGLAAYLTQAHRAAAARPATAAIGARGVATVEAVHQYNEFPGDPIVAGDHLSVALQTVSRVIRLNAGLRAATIDYGDWDTHVDQVGRFPNLLAHLDTKLMEFWQSLGSAQSRVTVVMMGEFGRRLEGNSNAGTDHGHGQAILVLGGGVNGGRMYGQWPGLQASALDNGDLAITTDYRLIVGEILEKRCGNTRINGFGGVFPDLQLSTDPSRRWLGIVA
ncbi:MAG TPA: DUF1501 domain-containing protein [Azospirillaceae bacterium]|nr:DUF1501 domain-containing protein [Azospirillaceae bacterium]